MLNFRDLIRKPNPTAAELRDAVASLSVADAEARVLQLESERRKLLIDGPEKELEKKEAEITAANREVERVGLAIEELTLRITGAEAREAEAALDLIEAEQREIWHTIKKAYLDIDAACEKILPGLAELKRCDEHFHENARKLGKGGRTDQKVVHPMTMLQLALNRLPGNIQTVADFKLPGYYPQRHPDNINFGSLKDIKL
jgi:chromosome segregation ATPase